MAKQSWRMRFYRAFFPEKLQLTTQETELLSALFPRINWAKTPIFNGLPWFAQRSFAIAMALPASLRPAQAAIYFKDYQSENNFWRTSTLVHEAFHIQQYHDLRNPWADFGYFRRFMRYYIGWYFAHLWEQRRKGNSWSEAAATAYRYHHLEIPAYDFEADFAKEYRSYQQLPAFIFIENYPQLCRQNAGKISRPPLWAWLLGSFVALLIAVTEPITRFVVGGIAALLALKD